ncbi:MAG: beta-propeller fold lactonase family protein [Oscillospiraceae bacterium]|nr:beta-propeller fold lactonase family protein [Oscillospiraceae bacterium]MDD4368558.1 beta-propeller fold lactonase family protein [Oscillospiraceae bacterium]
MTGIIGGYDRLPRPRQPAAKPPATPLALHANQSLTALQLTTADTQGQATAADVSDCSYVIRAEAPVVAEGERPADPARWQGWYLAVQERSPENQADPSSALLAFNPGMGLAQRQAIPALAPCFLYFDGLYVFTADYTSGTISCLAAYWQPDASLPDLLYLGALRPCDSQRARQLSADSHVHWVGTDPQQRWLLATDLGLDCILAYPLQELRQSLGRRLARLQSAQDPGQLARLKREFSLLPLTLPLHLPLTLPGGSGPRHLLWAEDGLRAYLLTELSCELFSLYWQADTFDIQDRLSLKELPGSREALPAAAALHWCQNRQFLLASVRGSNLLCSLKADANGQLTLISSAACGGSWPRDFAQLTGRGDIYCANERSDYLSRLQLAADGQLSLLPDQYPVLAPACVCRAWAGL